MRSIRNCNVAVIGGAGFLGSHLVDHLVNDRGCEVTVVDNLCVGRREFVHKDARFVHADITQSEHFLRRTFEERKIRFVFNYAAWPYIPDSFARPLQVFRVNADGAIQVINAAQEAGCEGVLQVSSAEIYGNGYCGNLLEVTKGEYSFDPSTHNQSLTENAPVIPHSTYGVAKAAVDAYVQTAWRERQTPCIALRQFNCVGERETHPYIVPEIISQLTIQTKDFVWCKDDGCVSKVTDKAQKGITPIVNLGNNSFRDFLYAGDAVKIAVELLERGQWGEVYNLGSETGIKMFDLAKLIGKVMGFADVQVVQDPARVRPWEIWFLKSCNDKVFEAIGWHKRKSALITLEDALRRTVKWFEENGRKWPWEK